MMMRTYVAALSVVLLVSSAVAMEQVANVALPVFESAVAVAPAVVEQVAPAVQAVAESVVPAVQAAVVAAPAQAAEVVAPAAQAVVAQAAKPGVFAKLGGAFSSAATSVRSNAVSFKDATLSTGSKVSSSVKSAVAGRYNQAATFVKDSYAKNPKTTVIVGVAAAALVAYITYELVSPYFAAKKKNSRRTA